MQQMVKELTARVEQISACQPTDALWQAAVKRGTLTAEGAWPYLTWSAKDSQLQTSSRAPLTMQCLLLKHPQHLQELLLVVKFQACAHRRKSWHGFCKWGCEQTTFGLS